MIPRVDEYGTGADGEALGESMTAVGVVAAEGSHIRGDSSHLRDCFVTILLEDPMAEACTAMDVPFLEYRGGKFIVGGRCCCA